MDYMGNFFRHTRQVVCAVLAAILIIYAMPVRAHAKALGNNNGDIESVQDLYERISAQIAAHEEQISYYTESFDIFFNITDVMDGYKYHYCQENPQLSGSYLIHYADTIKYTYWQSRSTGGAKYCIQVDIAFACSEEEMSSYFEQMRQQAELLKCENDYDSVKAVHDYIIEQVDYDDNYQNYLDYEGFQSGKMVCEGYSMAAYLLLANMGIPVRIITGTSDDSDFDGSRHAWNIVQLDGAWYNMDVTWDDLGGKKRRYTCFLKGDMDFENHFCDAELQEEYDRLISDTSYKLPFMDGLREGVRNSLTEHPRIIIVLSIVCVYMVSRIIRNRNRNRNREDLSQ